MKIGYARVSTSGQTLDQQHEALTEAGCEKIYSEKQSGTSTTKRDELQRCLDVLRAGDTLVITKIDRLARSVIDLSNIVNDLDKRGISIQFLNDGLQFQAGNKQSISTLTLNILSSFAQFERDLIVERTTAGRKRAQAQGKHIGRTAQPEQAIRKALKLYKERESNGMSVGDISKVTGVPRSTIYAELKKV